MTWLARAWTRFWFEPAPATDLGVARAIFFGGLALFYLPQDFSVWAQVSPTLYQPIWLFDRFHLPVLPEAMLQVLQIIWKLALALAAVGLFTRSSIFVSAALGTYLLGLPHNFGQIYHFDAVLVLAFGILAFSRAGDAWSIDSLRAAARAPGLDTRNLRGPEYRWPVQLVLVALSLVFFAAGVAKIWRSGMEWILSDHMALLLHRVQYNISDADPLVNWGSFIADLPYAARLMALTTIVVETAYPLALFSRHLRVPMVLAGVGLIVGIRLLMGPTFEHFLLINAFWVPWSRVGERLRVRSRERPTFKILYDGACGLCVPTVAVLRRLDLLGRVTFIDAARDMPRIAREFPQVGSRELTEEMHGITPEGRVVKGFETYRELARVLPLGWVFLPLLHLPPVAFVGRRVYKKIAHGRHRTACAIGGVPAPDATQPGVSDPDIRMGASH